MSFAPHQIILATFELLLLLVGAWVLARSIAIPELRSAVFGQNRIPAWHLGGAEAAILGLLTILCGMVGQGLAMKFLRPLVAEHAERAALEVVLFGLGTHGVALLGWPLFRLVRGSLHSSYGAIPTAAPRRQTSWRPVLWRAVTALVIAMPVLGLVSMGWELVLKQIGLPAAPQDLLAIFGAAKSPFVIAGLLFVACVVAPINEELLFRGVLFRSLHQKVGRWPALIVSGALFGALHGNWAGFLPLALLGVALALAYEHSGDIRVPIVVHALFNFNTTICVLAGLSA